MRRSLKVPDKLTRVVVSAHCPQCGRARRAFAADAAATELYVRCPCDIDPLFCMPHTNAVLITTASVGMQGGLTRSSVGQYVSRVSLWRQAVRLRDTLIELGATQLRLGPTLLGALTADAPTLSEVLFVMPASALHPGVEEWVALAQRTVLGALARGEATEEE